MKLSRFSTVALLVLCSVPAFAFAAQDLTSSRPRLVILTDIGGDPDDRQSLIRLLVHANEFDLEGLLATSAGTLKELENKTPRADLIEEIVNAYGKVQPNLALHAQDYPTADRLLKRIHAGQSIRGRKAIGEGHDTAASNWIIECVDKDDPRPLNVCIWGGQTDLGQALWRVRQSRSDADYQKFAARLRVFDIADQDQIADWLCESFPEVFYILGLAPPNADKRLGSFRGMYLGGDEELTSRDWVRTHVSEEHGPLGELYPLVTYTNPNPHKCLKEGDTPSWFYFLNFGLSDPEQPAQGNWGGRYALVRNQLFRDAPVRIGDVDEPRVGVWRWRPDFQNEFAARMDWCVKPFSEANHPPRIQLNGNADSDPLQMNVPAGGTISLSAAGSTDPDGNELRSEWMVLPEAGTCTESVSLKSTGEQVQVQIPKEATGQTIHVLLTVRDDGTPPLARYRRIILNLN